MTSSEPAPRWPLAYASLLFAAAVFLGASQFLPVAAAPLWAGFLLSALALTCGAVGARILELLSLKLEEPRRATVGLTLGLGLLCTALSALAAAGCLKPRAVGLLLGAFWLVAFRQMRAILRGLPSFFKVSCAAAPAAFALAALTFVFCALPPHLYDALVYHLELASLYAKHGGLTTPANLPYGFFPQNGEMLFSLALLLGSDTLANMFSWLAAMLAVLWIFQAVENRGSRAAWPAAFLILSHSAVMCLSCVAYVDTLVMLWVTSAVLCFLNWRDEGRAPAWLVLSAVFCGLGVGTKYTAGICPAILFLFLLAQRPSWRQAAVFAGVAAAAGAPWLLRNWLVIGNPVFPFLYSRFPMRGVAWSPSDASHYFGVLTEYGWGKSDWLWDLLRLPWQALRGGIDFGGGADVVGGVGWAPLLLLTPAAVLWGRKRPGAGLVLLYCCLHLAAWYSTRIMLRFLTAIVPLAAWPAAEGLIVLWDRVKERGRGLLIAAGAFLLCLNLGLFLYIETVFEAWGVLLGSETRTEYLSRRLEYYPCALWGREHLSQNDKILIVGEQRGYYVQQEHAVTSMIGENAFVLEADASADPAALARNLSQDGFSQLLLVPREAKRLAEGFSFTPKGAANFAGLSAYLRPEVDAGSCRLLALEAPHG